MNRKGNGKAKRQQLGHAPSHRVRWQIVYAQNAVNAICCYVPSGYVPGAKSFLKFSQPETSTNRVKIETTSTIAIDRIVYRIVSFLEAWLTNQ